MSGSPAPDPGDVGQLTLHAIAGLAQADVVLHDALVSGDVLALARPEAELVPAGKRCGRPVLGTDDNFGRPGRGGARQAGGCCD